MGHSKINALLLAIDQKKSHITVLHHNSLGRLFNGEVLFANSITNMLI